MRTGRQRRAVSVAALLWASLFLGSAPTFAQLEEVVVTAQKRAETAQSVPISISAFNADDVAALNLTDMTSLSEKVSNVVAFGPGIFVASYNIRGIGLNQFAGNFSTPVAMNVDEVYIGHPYMVPALFDIDRVEVLKGPQGTLFGRNTTGGAVNYFTSRPTKDFDVGATFTADQWGRYTGEAFVSGPLFNDLAGGVLAGRLSAFGNFGSGAPYENLYDDRSIGVPDRFFGRGQLQWTRGGTRINLAFEGGKDNSQTTPYIVPGIFNYDPNGAPTLCSALLQGLVSAHPGSCAKFAGLTNNPAYEYEPNNITRVYWNQVPRRYYDFATEKLTVSQETSIGTVTSVTAYQYVGRKESENSDGSAISSLLTTYETPVDVFSQELRLGGKAWESRFTYLAGLYYSHEHLSENDSANSAEDPLLGGLPGLGARFKQIQDSRAVFLNLELAATDALSFIAGGRYTRDRTSVDGMTFFPTFANSDGYFEPIVSIGAPFDTIDASRTDSNFSYKLGAQYQLGAASMAYANHTTGYRNGGYSVPMGATISSFKPEIIGATELGVKSEVLDHTLRLNAAVFHYDLSNAQLNVNDPTHDLVAITSNISRQKTNGAEMDVLWSPVREWELHAGTGYLSARFVASANEEEETYAGLIPLNGKQPPNSPRWNVNAGIQRKQPLPAGFRATFGLDARWVAARYLTPDNQVFDYAPSYTTLNGRISLSSPSGAWDLSLWANNLTDRQYLNYVNNVSVFKIDVWGERRTVGLTLAYHHL
ncbi:MAG TPA: TonB-dependent receptor [Steroidobacteraceae bacterium]|nr:TonB-dependent receptor [Steroidobacteraceae bacterium]